jgi:hypothetical protein
MKNQTIVIASIIGVGVLAFLGYKWYNKKKNASINESIVRNVDKNIEAIKKKKLATKQEGAIMGGLEENPFKKNNGLIPIAPIGNDSKPFGQLSVNTVYNNPLEGKPFIKQNGLTDLPINRIKL